MSADSNGNLVRQDIEGNLEVTLPDLARETSGLRILPGGDVLVNDVNRSSVVRVTPGMGAYGGGGNGANLYGVELGIEGRPLADE